MTGRQCDQVRKCVFPISCLGYCTSGHTALPEIWKPRGDNWRGKIGGKAQPHQKGYFSLIAIRILQPLEWVSLLSDSNIDREENFHHPH